MRLTQAIDNASPTTHALAVLAAIATWLISAGLIWQALINQLDATNTGEIATTAGVLPAVLAWISFMIINDTSNN